MPRLTRTARPQPRPPEPSSPARPSRRGALAPGRPAPATAPWASSTAPSVFAPARTASTASATDTESTEHYQPDVPAVGRGLERTERFRPRTPGPHSRPHPHPARRKLAGLVLACSALCLLAVAPAAAQNATGNPEITGFAQVGQTLTANKGTIADPDGLPVGIFPSGYTFQWVQRDGTTDADILGATSRTYAPTAANAGKKIKVKVGFTDGASNTEELTSESTAVVAAAARACPTSTSTETVAWCTTLTVGEDPVEPFFGVTPYGYCSAASGLCSSAREYGSLNATTFMLASTTYTVESLRWEGGFFRLLHLTLDRDFPDASLAGLVLQAGSRTYTLGTATKGHPEGIAENNYFWSARSSEFEEYAAGLEVTVALVMNDNVAPVFADDTLTRSFPENSAADVNIGAPIPAATDTNSSDILTYSITGAFRNELTFDAASRQLKTKTGGLSDHEALASYSVTIRVEDGNGGSDTVLVTINITDVDEPPSAPVTPGVAATAGLDTSLDVSWTAPDNDGKPVIDDYDLRHCAGAPADCATDGDFTDGPQGVEALKAAITGLTAGTTYQVQVRATNDEGDGTWSPSGAGSTTSPPPNSPPAFSVTTLTRSIPENSAANANVGDAIPAATDTNTSDTLTYSIEGTDAASFDFDVTTRQIKTKTGVIYDHETKDSYSVTIKVDDGKGGSDTVAVTINLTDEDERPSAPAAPSVAATVDSNTSLDVSWTAPDNADKPSITHYSLQFCQVGPLTCDSDTHFASGPQRVEALETPLRFLEPITTYHVQVRAHNDDGAGPWSDSGIADTNLRGANGAPDFLIPRLTLRVPENSAANVPVGEIPAALDPDHDPLIYSMEGRDAASFEFDVTTRQITTKSGVVYDFEFKPSYSVTIGVEDDFGGSDTLPVTINLIDVPEAPRRKGEGMVSNFGQFGVFSKSDLRQYDNAQVFTTGSDPLGYKLTDAAFEYNESNSGDTRNYDLRAGLWTVTPQGTPGRFLGDFSIPSFFPMMRGNQTLRYRAPSSGFDLEPNTSYALVLVDNTLTGVHPYARYAGSGGLSAWGVLGYGRGEMTLARPGRSGVDADTSMRMAAFGGRDELLSESRWGGFMLAVRSDALFVSASSVSVGGVVDAGAETRRVRLLLEGSHESRFGAESTLTSTLETGVRHDGGDAEQGAGIEVGGAVHYRRPAIGLAVDVGVRGLLTHEERGYEEWGMSASAGLAPGAGGRGLSLRLGSVWGAAGSGGAQQLWARRSMAGLAREADLPGARIDAEVGYGFGGPRGLLTPYTGVALSQGGEHWRAGARWSLGSAVDVSLEATLEASAGEASPESGLFLRSSTRW